jgi:N-6 DNA Methylase
MKARPDPSIAAHLEWLGFVQPTGLVFSAPALVRGGAILDRRDAAGQRLLSECVDERALGPEREPEPVIDDFEVFAHFVLGWSFSPKGYAGVDGVPIPDELEVALPEQGEILRPDLAVRERDPQDGVSPWQLLIRLLETGEAFDAAAHSQMERLLRETGVPAGLLFNGRALRLISAPRGESSGWLDFRIADMVQSAGRPICTAMRLLLSEPRLLTLPRAQRLAALLQSSRAFQNEVSEQLAEQVLHALYELLRGFQAAHDASGGQLLRQPLADRPDDVYRALLTVILRLVFLLYAEERDMLPEDETFVRFYSLAGLYERLREDDARYPDTMTQRYGAWPQLITLFRMVHDGARGGQLHMPPRHGALFDPDRFLFLEGRAGTGARQVHERIEPPLVPDSVVFHALDKLLVLGGERISYRALDVEQIGSVYETMMGFRLELATGRSVAVRGQSRYGAATTVDLEELIAEEPSKRAKWLADRADRKLTVRLIAAVKAAETIEDMHAVLAPVVDAAATPDMVPAGAMVLQPSEERRKTGSHYTPRSLTEPIVRTTLEPVLAGLRGEDRRPPRPEQVLELKVCDPAMGSGAFLVEACRQLGDVLVEGWNVHGARPEIPADEDEVTVARRIVAQRCLYGIDRNAVAVDLAKMSLWLATLAREHPLTFLDHALRHGDSLVGLTRRQIDAFHWKPSGRGFEAIRIGQHIARVTELRRQIREADDGTSDFVLRDLWDEAQSELAQVRLFGDLAVAAFFSGAKSREREAKRLELAQAVADGNAGRFRGLLEELREAEPPLVPFHWQVELPEVFDRERPGFDAIVGNPPFGGKNTITNANPEHYLDWLKELHEQSHGNADWCAHFYRRCFNLLRKGGAFGLIATNTIRQGDTRSTGLRWICTHGGEIYNARKRYKWPGRAQVVVSVVHVINGTWSQERLLDGHPVAAITAYLFHTGSSEDPAQLAENVGKSFQGTIVLGMGFTFDDTDTKGVATSLAEMQRLIDDEPRNANVIFPYIGGDEVNDTPTHAHHRYVINFGEREESECRAQWPKLMAIVEEKVKPERLKLRDNPDGRRRKEHWWQFGRYTPALFAAIADLDRVLVTCRHQPQWGTAFLRASAVFAESLNVFPFDTYAAFCALQSRPHEVWARFFGSSLEDRLRYNPSDCFETFPFPTTGWASDPTLEAIGRAYDEHRAALMVRNNEGLTQTYNRFHDPYERDAGIQHLRELHAEMDRAVLAAYGWSEIPTECEFLLDYPIDDEEWGNKRKPYHYRWPDDVGDEVLARLVALNSEWAAVERRSGTSRAKRGRGARRAVAAPGQMEVLL